MHPPYILIQRYGFGAKMPVKKTHAKKGKSAAKRTRMKKSGGKGYVYVIRDAKGHFVDIQNIGRCIRQDMKRKAKTKAKPGHKYKGD